MQAEAEYWKALHAGRQNVNSVVHGAISCF